MYCPDRLAFKIRKGDNLYQIAKHYNTTVQAILSDNPHIEPKRLRIGEIITICPGPSNPVMPYPMPMIHNMGIYSNAKRAELSNILRRLWKQHVMWTRMLIIGIVGGLADTEEVTSRLLRNPVDIGNVFRPYYGDVAANRITELLTQHLLIGGQLISAYAGGNITVAEELLRRWYGNADEIVAALASLNPYYKPEILQRLFYDHLNMTREEILHRVSGDYRADIATYDAIEQQAVQIADYLAEGIIKQFPKKF